MSEMQEVAEAPQLQEGAAAAPQSTAPSFGTDWWTLLTGAEFLRNPYPELKRLRELAPIHFDPATGVYFVLGHREFSQMAKSTQLGRDTRFWANGWSSEENRKRDPEVYELFTEFQPQMINANAPDHRRMRDVYEKAFRSVDLARYLPIIEEECQRLLDAVPLDEPFNFMTAFANVLPHRVSLRLFDVPLDMEAQVAKWITDMSWLGNIIMTSQQKRDARTSQDEFKAFVKSHLAARESNPGDGMIGLTLAAAKAGVMDENETLNNVAMLISGSKATLTLLGNGLYALLTNPDQFRKLRSNRNLLKPAIEEMLRFEPGSAIIPRAAITDFQVGPVCIPKGALAIGLVGAFNRDPERFKNPDVFDITRQPNPQSAFGGGPHVCIGKSLARMTAQVTFTALMDRYKSIELAGEADWWTDRSDQRGLWSLPLRVR